MSHDLFLAAREAMAKAYAPYSKFPVGAAIRTEDGRVFAGANIEVASYPEGWCAETTALGACFLFGFLDAVAIRLQGVPVPGIGQVPVQFMQALPYVLTVVLLAGFVGKAIPPRAGGVPYAKER